MAIFGIYVRFLGCITYSRFCGDIPPGCKTALPRIGSELIDRLNGWDQNIPKPTVLFVVFREGSQFLDLEHWIYRFRVIGDFQTVRTNPLKVCNL